MADYIGFFLWLVFSAALLGVPVSLWFGMRLIRDHIKDGDLMDERKTK